jgi:para-nitrobenzyl esterase
VEAVRGRIETARLDRSTARVLARVPGGPARADALLEGYRRAGEARIGANPLDVFCALETDRVYRIPALRLADAQARAGGAVYAYHFTWPSALLGGALGACHAVEVPFVFGTTNHRGARVQRPARSRRARRA